jgi:hypothetical protein
MHRKQELPVLPFMEVQLVDHCKNILKIADSAAQQQF